MSMTPAPKPSRCAAMPRMPPMVTTPDGIATTVAIEPTLAAGLCTTPTNYYVNFHTTPDPVGAIRGNFKS